MATTSIWRVNGWLGKVLIYIENPDKTETPAAYEKQGMDGKEAQGLSDVIEYAIQQKKTEKAAVDDEDVPVMQRFVSGVNCSPTTARDEMIAVKKRFGKEEGTVAYHGYQSFAPGEATPEMAHEIGLKLAKYGVTYWLPLASAANVAQGAAALAVGIKSKDKKIKSLALPSSLSAFMGITEPANFGVNLRFFKPFIAGCIGGGCGALYASLVHLGAKGTGVTGIFGILLCLNQPLQYIIEMAISVGVAFVISFMIYKDKEPVVKTAATETTVEKTEETENVVEAENVSAEEITSPVNGNVVATAEVADETFASEMLGTTIAVEPTDGKIVAPCDGEVMNIFDTGHAVCIATEAGAELLIHIGIDTVSMDGKGFVKKVADGAKVRKGDVLIEADLDAIKAAGHPATTMMILTNADDFSKVEKTAAGTVTTADLAMKIEK